MIADFRKCGHGFRLDGERTPPWPARCVRLRHVLLRERSHDALDVRPLLAKSIRGVPTAATTCARSKITLGIAIPSTVHYTRVTGPVGPI
jgi:hypothetical protein